MAALRLIQALLIGAVTAATAIRAKVSPVEQVITLLEDLKTQVEGEGKEEASAYDKFACFCKDTTDSKSTKITDGRDNIDQLSADIEADTATKAEKSTELGERKKKQEEHQADLEEETIRCQKESAEFEAQVADLTKAVKSLEKAKGALEGAKPAALLQMQSEVADALALADALSLIPEAKKKSVQAFLQGGKVDPDDPVYKFHSQGILDTVTELLKEFSDKLTEVQEEQTKANTACTDSKKALGELISKNNEAMDALKTDIDNLETAISDNRESLVTAESALKDDQTYLKDLTERCEARAKDWDQRSGLRADEIKALTQALTIIKDGKDGGSSVSELDAVNKRAFVQKGAAAKVPKKIPEIKVAPSFIQGTATRVLARAHNLRGNTRRSMMAVDIGATQWGQDKAVAHLRSEGIRLKSEMLTSLANKAMKDPFVKVKQLIQQLIERLLNEATQEATKKGFCDEELGKAKNARDFKFQEIKKLTAELTALEVKKEELNTTIKTLAGEVVELTDTLNTTTSERETDKEQNAEAIKTAKEGVAAVSEAITILKVFYKNAAKATVLVQKASPVDEDTEGAGFSGAYKGNQEQSDGIIGMLEVIKSDFERTLRTTEAEEKKAAAEFVKFDRTSRSDIKGKETTKELSEQDLKATKAAISKTTDDLETSQGLLDDALKAMEDLKPMCIDTGMSYSDRVAKREEEIAALKTALCQLDPNGVEAECA